MSDNTAIEWSDASWNPVTGCTKVSQGCKNCYAERMALRLQKMHRPRYENGFAVTLHHDLIDLPRRWKKPRRIFVNSMSDLFHEDVPAEFIAQVFNTINLVPRHTFQILTKRPENALAMAHRLPWPHNLLMGTSVEDRAATARIQILRQIPAKYHFLSIEPLLEGLPSLNLRGIHWVIVGGESGPKSRPIEADWVRDLRDQCLTARVPFFFKQWGGVNKKKTGRTLDGRTWDEVPEMSGPSPAPVPSFTMPLFGPPQAAPSLTQ